jgi:hypothetical protein
MGTCGVYPAYYANRYQPRKRVMGDEFMEQSVKTAAARNQAASCQGGVFVPIQENADMWTPQESLCMGTAFPCLYSPWEKGDSYYE